MAGDLYLKLSYDPLIPPDRCIFRCGNGQRAKRPTLPPLRVEMCIGSSNRRFLASMNDEPGAVRIAGVAHVECYEAWRAIAYGPQ